MARRYEVRQDDKDDSKYAVWLVEDGADDRRAIPGIRFDTEHRADEVCEALNDAYAAGNGLATRLAYPQAASNEPV